MNKLGQDIGTARTIHEIYEQSALKVVVDARAEFGMESQEFKTAQLNYQIESAKDEAEYQTRKAANQAWLYENGY